MLNEEGDTVWSTTAVQPPWTWWPDLTPDICKLVAGSLTWDLPDHTDLHKPPPDKQCVPSGIGSTFGCSGQFYRANLRSAEFYVCPGQPRKLRHQCGGAPDFYCAAWGCETTGGAYWNPTSTWDLITVKRGSSYDQPNQGERDSSKYLESGCSWFNSPNGPCKDNYCNPIRIKFTDQGKRERQSWLKGNNWGLRLDEVGKDPGLVFKIKLTVESPSPVPIGPNKALPEQDLPAKPKPLAPIIENPLKVGTSQDSPTTISSDPSTGQRLFNLIRGAFYALNSTDPDATTDCWLCLSSVPPYYEGIALNGEFNTTTSHASCSWGTEKKLTLTEVSGKSPGLCIGTPPPSHQHLCNRTHPVSRTSTNHYLVPTPVGWWACNTGLTPCVSTNVFDSSKDFCVMVQLLPRIYYHTASSLEDEYTNKRIKREPVTLTLATLVRVGLTVRVGTGVSALIEGRQGIKSLRDSINEDLSMLEKSINTLEKSLTSLSEVVLQNRRDLDLLSLREGGLCAALKEECCFYADHMGIVRDSMQKLRERLEKRKRDREAQQGWFESWFFKSPWMTTLFSALAGPLLIICLALIFGPCLINQGIAFVNSRVNVVQLMVLQHQY